jgi:hypothetical protein
MSQPFNSDQYLRGEQRIRIAKGTEAFKQLRKSMGYDDHVEQLLNAERFFAVVGVYPSAYIEIVRSIFEDVSPIAIDHVKEEVLAVISIVTEAAIEELSKEPIQDDDQLRELLQKIATNARIAYEEACGHPLDEQTFPVHKMTLAQARAYVNKWSKHYHQLPGEDFHE